MARIGFIGLGNMGLPMAQNLIKAAHAVCGFDLSKASVEKLAAGGGKPAASVAEACKEAEFVITMLPAGEQVRAVYLGADGVLAGAPRGALLIDSSTIDVESARAVAKTAQDKKLAMLDAPVSGGVAGAQAGTLTFMVGGPALAFERARPVLEAMGKTIVHAGGAGNGQAAKICNNMILGASMIVVSEAFLLAEKLGLDAQKLFDISSEVVRPVLVDDELLPGAGPGADLARQPRLQGGLHRRDDAQGLEARAGCRARDARQDAARRRCCRGLRAIRRQRRQQRRFFRHHPVSARGVNAVAATADEARVLMRARIVNGALPRTLALSIQSSIHRCK